MKLNRRDAVAALAAAGVAVGGGGAVLLSSSDGDDADPADDAGPIDDQARRTLVAAAETLYPSELDGVEEFVTDYVDGRAADRPEHVAGMRDAATYLDEYSQAWFDDDFAALDRETRSDALQRMNADTSEPDPGGEDVERVRYYVVNELLYALYTTPTGGKLAGIENPPGYPGGTESYQRGPPGDQRG